MGEPPDALTVAVARAMVEGHAGPIPDDEWAVMWSSGVSNVAKDAEAAIRVMRERCLVVPLDGLEGRIEQAMVHEDDRVNQDVADDVTCVSPDFPRMATAVVRELRSDRVVTNLEFDGEQPIQGIPGHGWTA